jgi:4-amino-4-deoxy-L-arabinose transferase-like glycosyltransferase
LFLAAANGLDASARLRLDLRLLRDISGSRGARARAIQLVLLVSLIALPALATRELMPTDEPRFALVARQMVEDPAPIVPHLGYDALTRQGEPYADKPPVFFWLISLFSLVTGGVSEVSARLPSFLSAIAAVLITWRLGSLLVDEAVGFLAAAILATSSQFFLRASWCSIDMLLTALTLGATLCWLHAAREPSSRTGPAAMGGLLAAAATLSKGPVGLIYPLAFLACDRIAARWPYSESPAAAGGHGASPEGATAIDPTWAAGTGSTKRAGDRGHPSARISGRRSAWLRPTIAIAAATFIIPVAVWIACITIVGGAGYAREILFHQTVTRYFAAWNNQQPWSYYFYRLPIGLLPWTLLLPAALLAPRGRSNAAARALRGLLLAACAIFVFFTISTGKRGVYLLPLYPALAILLASAWARTNETLFRRLASVHVLFLATLGAMGGAALVVAGAFPALAAARSERFAPYLSGRSDLRGAFLILGLLFAGTTVGAAVLFFRGRRAGSLAVFVPGLAALIALGSWFVVPEMNRRSGLRGFGAKLASVAGTADHLIVDDDGYEQILFYSRLRGARRDFARSRLTHDDAGILLEEQRRHSSEPGTSVLESPAPTRVLSKAESGVRSVRFPAGERVVFVVKGTQAAKIRDALGPFCLTLLTAPIAGEPYVVLSSR